MTRFWLPACPPACLPACLACLHACLPAAALRIWPLSEQERQTTDVGSMCPSGVSDGARQGFVCNKRCSADDGSMLVHTHIHANTRDGGMLLRLLHSYVAGPALCVVWGGAAGLRGGRGAYARTYVASRAFCSSLSSVPPLLPVAAPWGTRAGEHQQRLHDARTGVGLGARHAGRVRRLLRPLLRLQR